MVHKHFLSEIWHGKVTMISHCYNSILIENFVTFNFVKNWEERKKWFRYVVDPKKTSDSDEALH